MTSVDYIKDKYKDILGRSFNTKLDIFLFDRAIRKASIEEITPEDFNRFKITKESTELYQKAWQLKGDESLLINGPSMNQIDSLVEEWSNSQTELKQELFRQYKALFMTEYFPFSEFEQVFNPDPKKRICHYCKISDEEISKLRSRGRIYSKVNRGYSMEIDRLKPNREYSKKNCVLACYWCNNAKSDEFTSIEYSEHIGPGIGSIWEERGQ